MSPDDPRHGTTAGYHAGCRELCCRRAIAAYEKRGRLNRVQGTPRAVLAIGAQRRIQALMWLGWDMTALAAEAGWAHRNQVRRILVGQKGKPCRYIQRSTHETICEVFERLSMRTPPEGPVSRRTASMARRKGYAPPLAWDDIDNDAAPKGKPRTRSNRPVDEIDHAVVSRVMEGERMRTTPAEKREVVRRWLRDGRPLAELERRQGWKADRYTERGSDYEETA